MEELNLETIKKLEIEMLSFIDDICNKNNIIYTLDYGTLLGCVRHKGFIPWDDDIDIAITKDGYNQLKNLINSQNGRYKFIDAFTNDDYHYPFGKIVDTNTKLIEDGVGNIKNMGLFIDVFIKYPITNNDFLWKLTYLKYQIRVYLMYFTSYDKYSNILFTLLSKILKPFVNNNILSKQMIKIVSKQEKDKDRCVSTGYIRKISNYHHFEERIKEKFENKEFYIPKEYDKVLKNYYGDYMTLPPIENRVSNHEYHAYYVENKEGN